MSRDSAQPVASGIKQARPHWLGAGCTSPDGADIDGDRTRLETASCSSALPIGLATVLGARVPQPDDRVSRRSGTAVTALLGVHS
jgi:hypothetical protein